ncbi:MAG: hypothetical protein Q4A25_00055 [Candidatus Saccharibacteria bacterium]|nr:hypothetical protein [Candidatus Saccharibacteria bacterium]
MAKNDNLVKSIAEADFSSVDVALDKYIGRTIFRLKNPHLDDLWSEDEIDKFLCTTDFSFGYLSMKPLYISYKKGDLDRKAFILFLDLKLSLIETVNSFYNFILVNNEATRNTRSDRFIMAIEAHDMVVTFILRYRALWDKFMGYIVYDIRGDGEYEKFVKAARKKTKFRKLFVEVDVWESVGPYIKKLEEFDNKFRTPEAHLGGRAYKKILKSDGPFLKDEYFTSLIEHFNFMLNFVPVFSRIIESK